MTLSDWAVLVLIATVVVAHRVRRAVRKWVRRRLRRGLGALLAVWLWRQALEAWKGWRAANRPRPAVLRGDDVYRACPLSRWRASGCDPAACRWCGARLLANRRQFCGPQCTDEALDNHHFNRARSVARRRDRYLCRQCGSSSRLQVHHVTAVLGRHGDVGCFHHLDGLVTLCESCHQGETNRQRRSGAFRRRAA